MTNFEPWSLNDRLDKAKIIAKGGGTIEDIQTMARVTREQAVVVFVRANSKDGGAGLMRNEKRDEPWLRECLAVMAGTKGDEAAE